MSHTREPWKVVNRGDDECSDIDAKGPEGWNFDVTVAMNIGNDSARRIVACVNACAGITTENLQSVVDVGDTLLTRFQYRDRTDSDLMQHRNELLAAANEAIESGENGDWQTARRVLESAIANVKGTS